MNGYLLNREAGDLLPSQLRRTYNNKLIQALQPPNTRFERTRRIGAGQRQQNHHGESHEDEALAVAHHGGINSIAIDRFEGRYLLSGGADASIAIWDLESSSTTIANTSPARPLHTPLAAATKSDTNHTHGITQLSFYPFDSLAFLSSSYDHTLKIWSSETLQPSASFNLESVVYAHAVSPIAQHLLVACATQHPALRLVDLRSGAAAHALPGHTGALLSVAWSPVDEHILASAGTDGTVKFWDIRRSAALLAALDMEDSVGIMGYNGRGSGARPRTRGKAHVGPVNGILWTPDGRHMITTGHDEKIRVWSTITGANTLANFGPLVKNKNLSQLLPCLVSPEMTATGRDIMFFPSEREILMYEVYEGRLLKRLRPPGTLSTGAAPKVTQKQRITDLAWRPFDVELYSAHGDGVIRAWKPRVKEDVLLDEEEKMEREAEGVERERKRKVLEDVYRDFARKRVDFSLN
jgi:DNA excision repair protein ERCC-8